MNRTPLRVIISGAGAGGLSLASALTKKSQLLKRPIQVRIFEKQPSLDLIFRGSGCILTSAVPVLSDLGLKEQINKHAGKIESSVYFNLSGKRLKSNDIKPEFWLGIDRGTLLRALYSTLPPDTIQFNRDIHTIEMDEDEVFVKFEDGTEESADVFVGCDGITSSTRLMMYPNEKVNFWNSVFSVGTVRSDQVPDFPLKHSLLQYSSTIGKWVRIFPSSSDGSISWTLTERTNNVVEEEWKYGAVTREQLIESVAKFPSPVRELVSRTAEEDILSIGLYTRSNLESLEHYFQGRAILLGDAVHAMKPWTGQGTNHAICDGALLARCLTESKEKKSKELETIDFAFTKFKTLRSDKAQALRTSSESVGGMMMNRGWLGGWLRDKVLPKMLTGKLAVDALNREIEHGKEYFHGPPAERARTKKKE